MKKQRKTLKERRKTLILTAASGAKIFMGVKRRGGYLAPWFTSETVDPADPTGQPFCKWFWAFSITSIELHLLDADLTKAELTQVIEAVKATGFPVTA